LLTCHIVIRPGARPPEVDRIHPVAGQTLSCWTDGDTKGRHRAACRSRRGTCPCAMMIGPCGYDAGDLAALAAAANDENGRAEMTQ
jgi:hypothetical protein